MWQLLIEKAQRWRQNPLRTMRQNDDVPENKEEHKVTRNRMHSLRLNIHQ